MREQAAAVQGTATIDELKTEIGRRIKAARLERGMSLTQLGGSELSRSFLSSVEHGRIRISIRALSIVADRLGLPLSYFMDTTTGEREAALQLTFARAEAAIRGREPQEALRLLEQIEVPDHEQGQAGYFRGWALIDSGRPGEAITVLENALTHSSADDQPRQHLLLEYRLAVASYLAGHYDSALNHFRAVLQRMTGELDDQMLRGRIMVCMGHIRFVHQEFEAALNHYARARQLFGTINDLDNLASVYAGLSRVYEHKDDHATALRYARLSAGIYEAQHHQRFAARELNDMAVKYADLGKLSEALECANRAITLAHETSAPQEEALARSTLAAIFLEQEELEAARREAEHARRLAPERTDLAWIDATVILAKLADRQADYQQADESFTAALEALEQRGHTAEFAEVALAHSLSLQRRGDVAQALQLALKAAQARVG